MPCVTHTHTSRLLGGVVAFEPAVTVTPVGCLLHAPKRHGEGVLAGPVLGEGGHELAEGRCGRPASACGRRPASARGRRRPAPGPRDAMQGIWERERERESKAAPQRSTQGTSSWVRPSGGSHCSKSPCTTPSQASSEFPSGLVPTTSTSSTYDHRFRASRRVRRRGRRERRLGVG